MTREELIEAIMEAEGRITLDTIYKVRAQRRDATLRNARGVKRIASGLDMRKPKMRKYAKSLYKDYV